MGKMRKNSGARPQTRDASGGEPQAFTLKDMLGAKALDKLKSQTDAWKAREAAQREQEQLAAEERRKQEQKRLENSFEHLLNASAMDWKKFK